MQDTQPTTLYVNYLVEAQEFKPTGEIVTHMLTKHDINEMFRKKQFLESFLDTANLQLDRIRDRLSAHAWYDADITKQDVLNQLCEILGHEPKATLNWVATIKVEGSTDVPLDEVENFDLRYFLNDDLTVDIYHGDTVINSHYVDDIDTEQWE